MAEENGDLEVVEPGAAPADGEGDGQQVETDADAGQHGDPVTALATELGWRPQDQFRGAPEDWKEPADFIRASRDINRGLSRELRGVREQIERMGGVTSQIVADKIAERDAYWQGVHRKAVDDGNHELAERAVEERVKLKSANGHDTQPGEPQETLAFRERHKAWFGKDRVATARAMEVAEVSRRMGASVSEQLDDAERAIRREFPEHFPKASKTPPATQTGASRNAGGGSREKGFADMPAESQKMAIDLEQRLGVKREDTAKSYWLEEARRRVG